MNDFDLNAREELARLLEGTGSGANWQHLALQLLGSKMDEIRYIDAQEKKVDHILSKYEASVADASIPALYDACRAIERYDTLRLFKKFQEEDNEVDGYVFLQDDFNISLAS